MLDLDHAYQIVMAKYNLLEYSESYSIKSESLWNYYRDEKNYGVNENNAARNRMNNNKTITSKFFEYKTKLIGRTPNNNNTLEIKMLIHLFRMWKQYKELVQHLK